jgi:Domain of unknown function (DUF4232)
VPSEHRGVRPLASALLALAVVLALSACGSSTTTSVTVASGTGQTSTSSSASTSTSATQTTSSTSTSVSSGTPLCTASLLSLSYLGGQGATGHGELGFALKNTSSASCHTFGYPGVLFLDKAGGALPTNSTRTTHDFFGTAPEVAIVLAPGESASFRLGVTHGMASTAGCTTADGLQVIPPDDTHTLRVSLPNGAYECGTATVSPLRPGSSAYP